MKPRPRLFTAEPEALGGNGPSLLVLTHDGEQAAFQEVAIAEAPPAAPAAEAKPPSLLEKISASIQSKGTLLATGEAYRLRAETAETENAALHLQLTTLTSQLATLTTERAAIAALLETAQSEKQEVEVAAAATVAALGFDAAALPAAGQAAPETRKDLEAKLATTTDNAERFALAEKINALD